MWFSYYNILCMFEVTWLILHCNCRASQNRQYILFGFCFQNDSLYPVLCLYSYCMVNIIHTHTQNIHESLWKIFSPSKNSKNWFHLSHCVVVFFFLYLQSAWKFFSITHNLVTEKHLLKMLFFCDRFRNDINIGCGSMYMVLCMYFVHIFESDY